MQVGALLCENTLVTPLTDELITKEQGSNPCQHTCSSSVEVLSIFLINIFPFTGLINFVVWAANAELSARTTSTLSVSTADAVLLMTDCLCNLISIH